MRVVGLTGLARAGKDTTARLAIEWCEATGLSTTRLAFADPLKVSAARALGFDGTTEECVEFCNRIKKDGVSLRVDEYVPPDCGPDPVPPEWIPLAEVSGREFLQLYGTEAHREVFGTDFWVEATFRKINELGHGTADRGSEVDVVFITDARFPNEAAAIRNLPGGEVWQIVRDDAGLSDGLEAHASEAGLLPESVDLIITNNGTINELGETVRSRCEERI